MKVLILNNSDKAIGGTEIYSGQLADCLRAHGHEAMLASRHWVQGPPIGEESPVIVDRRAALHKILKVYQPDLIHINNPEAWFIELRALRKYGTVVFLHSPYPLVCPGDGRYFRQQERACDRRVGPYCLVAPWRHRCGPRNVLKQSVNLALANRWRQFAPKNVVYVGASDWTCNQLRAEGYEADRVLKTPLGLPEQEADEASVERPQRSPHPTILFVGRMIPVKGASHLLQALKLVSHSTKVIFVGDGPERLPLMNYANTELPDHHQIDFAGWRTGEDLERLRQQADFVVMPSMWPEPFGLVGLESFRAGAPVIAYQTGGMGEWLQDGKNGLFVPPGDIPALAKAINRLIEDRSLCRQLGAQGKRDQAERYTFANHWQKLEQAYDLAMAQRAK